MPPLEDKLAAVFALSSTPHSAERSKALARALGDASNLVVARAAEVAGASGNVELVTPLCDALERLLRAPAAVDKQCRAKEAIVAALEALGSRDARPYLQATRHVQMEPVWGGRTDTAPGLRAAAMAALARLGDREAYYEAVRMLTDTHPVPRKAAAEALAYLGGESSDLLLRLKAHAGDADPTVLGRVFSALLTMDGERSAPFVGEFLTLKDADVSEQAALALGESRRDDAAAALLAYWETAPDPVTRARLLLPLALSRTDASFAFLLGVIRDEGRTLAVKAVESLGIYATDERRWSKVHVAVKENGMVAVREAFAEVDRRQ